MDQSTTITNTDSFNVLESTVTGQSLFNTSLVDEMATMSVSSNITPIPVATSAANSSAKQRTSVVKRRTFQRKVYGFVFFKDELEEWGRQQFGHTDDEKVLEGYLGKTFSRLFKGCYRLWRRTSVRFVSCHKTGPHRHERDFCVSLADNISPDTATLPSREIIDMMKKNLRIEKDPKWYSYDGN